MNALALRVVSADGVGIAVYDSGSPSPGASTVVLVHGYPDNHAVWDGVANLLRVDHRVVSYDVRGAGDSDKPDERSAYRIPRLIDDLVAVLDAVSPDQPVHIAGHDWGSIQLWPALSDPGVAGRIASFTSISGPSLDYAAAWLRRLRQHPRASLRQLAHSYYMLLFQLPVLPELAVRRGVIDRGVRRARIETGNARLPEPPRSEADKLNGIWLYRANTLRRIGMPRTIPTDVAVQVIVPENDPFATPQLAREAPRPWVADLTVQDIPGGHWVVHERPDLIAALIREYVRSRTTAAAG